MKFFKKKPDVDIVIVVLEDLLAVTAASMIMELQKR